jgi:hypothetical protein
MGYNLISACHKCKVKIFHYRGEENETILPFYLKHKGCFREHPWNIQTIIDQSGFDPTWAYREDEGGYKDDELQIK